MDCLKSLDPKHLEEFENRLRGRVTTRRVTLMVFMLMIYDCLTTLDREVKHIWKNPWTLTNIIFLLNRYLPPLCFGLHLYLQNAMDLSYSFCRGGQMVVLLTWVFISILASGVIMLRVWALYHRNRFALQLILASYLACITPAFVVVGIEYAKTLRTDERILFDFDAAYSGVLELEFARRGCGSGLYPKNAYALFACSLAWESVLFVATLWKVTTLDTLRAGIVKHLYRDGLLYYLAMMLILLSGVLGAVGNLLCQSAVASGYVPGLKAVMVSHLLLRLKDFLHSSPPGQDKRTLAQPPMPPDIPCTSQGTSSATTQSPSWRVRVHRGQLMDEEMRGLDSGEVMAMNSWPRSDDQNSDNPEPDDSCTLTLSSRGQLSPPSAHEQEQGCSSQHPGLGSFVP